MPATEELRVLIRTVADTSGAQQTQHVLKGVQQQAARTTERSGMFGREKSDDLLRFASSLVGVNLGLNLASGAADKFREVLASSLEVARDHERIIRATAASYGQQATNFTRFASTLSQQTGFTSDAILEAALSARTLSTNYGLTIQQTQKLISVSADLARIRGIGIAESFERVQSAIRGEAEASEYLGLTLNDTYIANNAMNGSLKTTFNTMTDQQKAQVRYNELLKQTADFSGLASANTDSLDAAFRRTEKSAHDLQLELGNISSPIVIRGLQGINVVLEAQELRIQALKRDWQNLRDAITQPFTTGAGRISDQLQDIHDRPVTGVDTAAARAKAARDLVAQQDAVRKAVDATNRRLIEQNTIFTPQADNAQATARLAYLDQVDAAVRDLLLAQARQTDLQKQAVQLSADEARIKQTLLPVQQQLASAQRNMAEQQARARLAALPASEALEDLQYEQQRNRLIASNRNMSAEERREARRSLRTLARAEPGVSLSALDAARSLVPSARAADRLGLQAQLTDIGLQRALSGIQGALEGNQLAQAIAAATTQGQQDLVDKLIAANRDQPLRVTVNVQLPDGTFVSYDELVEANGQAKTPPTITQSAVRR